MAKKEDKETKEYYIPTYIYVACFAIGMAICYMAFMLVVSIGRVLL